MAYPPPLPRRAPLEARMKKRFPMKEVVLLLPEVLSLLRNAHSAAVVKTPYHSPLYVLDT